MFYHPAVGNFFSSGFGPQSEWFWTMVQAVVVGLTAWYIYRQIHAQNLSNMLQTILALTESWNSDRMLRARVAICKDYIEERSSDRLNDLEKRVADFFENIGLYLAYGCIKADVIWELYSYDTEHYWPLISSKIETYQTEKADETWYENFQALQMTMRKVSQERGVEVFEPTQAALLQFARGELQILDEKMQGNADAVEEDRTYEMRIISLSR